MPEHTERPARDRPAGLHCWNCGHAEFRVQYTRRRPDGIYRRRECLKCGKRFTTCERRLGA